MAGKFWRTVKVSIGSVGGKAAAVSDGRRVGSAAIMMPGMTQHLHIDPFSGIAGDMFLGALVDLGVSLEDLQRALAPLPVALPYRITTRKVYRLGIGAIDLKVVTEGAAAQHASHTHDHAHSHEHAHHHHDEQDAEHHHHHHHADAHHHHSHEHAPHHHHHHHTSAADVLAMIDQLQTAERAKDRARRVVTLLAQAEARVHGKPVEKIHFHEVGAVDSIVDMLGSVVALELLEIDTLSSGPLPLSRGYVRCAHGVMPVPAPATTYLLEGIPTVGVDRMGELVTPTGAALVAGLCESFGPPPAMTMRGVGYGAGDREDPQVPNLLRVMLGERLTSGDLGPVRV